MVAGLGRETYMIERRIDANDISGMTIGDKISITFKVSFDGSYTNPRLIIKKANCNSSSCTQVIYLTNNTCNNIYGLYTKEFTVTDDNMVVAFVADFTDKDSYSPNTGGGCDPNWTNAIYLKDWKLTLKDQVINTNTALVATTRVLKPEYRFGFQGQERDDEIKGLGNSWNYKYRMHDPRLGRFFSIDPLSSLYPWNSSYGFSENSVIAFIELEGLEKHPATGPPGGNAFYGFDFSDMWSDAMRKWWGFDSDDEMNAASSEEEYHAGVQTSQSKANAAKLRVATANENLKNAHIMMGHGLLDVVGMVPLVGEPADAINAGWYAAEGNYVDAAFSSAAVIPILGWLATGTKWSLRTSKYVAEVENYGGVFEAIFKANDDVNSLGLRGFMNVSEDGKHVSLTHLNVYMEEAASTADHQFVNTQKLIFSYRTALASWAKANGYETLTFIGERADDSSSALKGKEIKLTLDLTQ